MIKDFLKILLLILNKLKRIDFFSPWIQWIRLNSLNIRSIIKRPPLKEKLDYQLIRFKINYFDFKDISGSEIPN